MLIKARKLLDIPPSEMMNYLTGEFELQLDDGIIQTNAKETMLSSFLWSFQRQDPHFPLRKAHHITTHLEGIRLQPDTHTRIIEALADDWFDIYHDFKEEHRLEMLKELYQGVNELYNVLSVHTKAYYTTVGLLDFVEAIEHPEIQKIRTSIEPTPKNISVMHQQMMDTIKNHKDFKGSVISNLIKSRLVKVQQLLQCLGPWGYPSDIDSFIFKNPITRGYVEGLTSLHDSLVESRTAALALAYTDSEIAKVEFYSRKSQLIAMTLQNLHRCDCGSDRYMPFEIRNEKELKRMVGTYFNDDGYVRQITEKDKHLIGEVVDIRNVFDCMHDDPHGVCEVCFGGFSRNVIERTNLGHFTIITINGENTQLVISKKHYQGSGVPTPLRLSGNQLKYFIRSKDEMGYVLNPNNRVQGMKLTISKSAMINISSLIKRKSLDNLSPSRVTEMKSVLISTPLNDDVYATEEVQVEFQGRLGYFTTDFLEYIRQYGYTIDKGNYVFDLSNWKWDKTIIECPQRQFNILDFTKGIGERVEGRSEHRKKRASTDPRDYVKDFCDYIWEEMPISFSVLQCVIYGISIVSLDDNDYSLPKPWTKAGIGTLVSTMRGRSLGAACGFQDHHRLFTDPSIFLDKNRPDSPMDWILMPNEVLKAQRTAKYPAH